MTTEEKAKAYDEALERARIHSKVGEVDKANLTAICQDIFPELRESEDERMMKVIGLALMDVPEGRFTSLGTTLKDCLAYLKKQKEHFRDDTKMIEQKPEEWNEDYLEEDIQTRFAFYTYKDDPSVLYLSNVFVEETSRNHGFGTRILKAAEKAAEAIGAITICLKVKQDSPANAWYRKRGYGYVAFEDGYDWLEKNLEYLKPAKSAEWSEEDEWKRKELIQYLEEKGDYRTVWMTWLKSLRPQSQQNMSISFMLYLDEIRPEGKMCLSNGECNDIEDAFKKQDWPRLFKYINKYQPHWKPSEVQVEAVRYFVNKHQSEAWAATGQWKQFTVLRELLGILEKLM